MVARICDLPLYLHYHCTPTIRKQILADLWTCAAHSNPDFRNGMWSIDVECCGKFDTPFEFHRFPIFHRGECLSKFCFTIPTDTMLRVIGRVWIPRVLFPQVFEIFETIFSERWNHRLGNDRIDFRINKYLVLWSKFLLFEFVLLF